MSAATAPHTIKCSQNSICGQFPEIPVCAGIGLLIQESIIHIEDDYRITICVVNVVYHLVIRVGVTNTDIGGIVAITNRVTGITNRISGDHVVPRKHIHDANLVV